MATNEDSVPVALNVPNIERPPLSRNVTTSDLGRVPLQAMKNTVLKSHGRPPWYGEDGLPLSEAFVVGIAGGSASGKTHVAHQIVKALGSIPSVVILSQDSFYRKHTPEQVALAHANRIDFDHPDAIDMPLFTSCLADLKACKQTNIPIYSFSEHQRLDETKYLYGAAIIITEGILALHNPDLRALCDLKIFVQCDSDLMLARRIRRDVKERGRTVDGVLDQYLRYVKPSYDHFVLPTSRYADIIVPGSDNSVAIDLVATHIGRQLKARANRLRSQLALAGPREQLSRQSSPLLPPPEPWLNLIVVPETPQIKGILTILRDSSTSRGDFIFFVDRLATYLMEKAMELLPYTTHKIETPTGEPYVGKKLEINVCGVSVLRSGGPLERGLRRVAHNIAIGSLLIQSEAATGEPLLLHLALPVCIRERHRASETYVFLLDAQIGTAASAFMAIRVLLDHGVPQDHIIFVTFLVAKHGGIVVLRKAFPQVRIICSAVDEHLTERWLECINLEGEGLKDPSIEEITEGKDGRKVWVVEPGMGHIGDRYYL